ncbi:HAD family hydrolase [Micromonospora sp. KC606]|uniref:HAD family hydrolase n=1 Tax=Micromonospora sp. KC606 TaxID=2530379 RepID=UPI00104D7198|nr:HAD-IA family hydrolase [Micromonospora sp. KC606]TDC84972.1 HAD family hydrolase [Micromonospora sp. KC606]
MPLRLLLFDFDGLLCDTERAAHRSWDEVYAQLLGHGLPDRVWAAMAGRSDGEAVAVADLSARLGRPLGEAARAARLRRKRELCAAEPERPGVTALLDAGRAAGLGLGVVSSSSLSWVDSHLARLGLRHRFDRLVTGDDTPWHKPAPDLYRLALRRAGVPAADAVAFEDSESGVRAARAAGVYCVAVRNAVGAHADLSAADEIRSSLVDVVPDAYLNRLTEAGNR